MSRWHKGACSQPDIEVVAGVPTCRSCRASFSPQRALAGHEDTLLPLSIPPDEPAGALNLRWPPSVPWAVRDTLKADEAAHEGDLAGSLKQDRARSKHSSSLVYERPITLTEIRLICVHAAEDRAGPIHVTMHIFPDDDCPEYEAVSYTWRSEDGSSAAEQPVFVGPWWDVILQTKNCWSLLRYLRPWQGSRMVWIDALCIDQKCQEEKDAQVSKMGFTYLNCSRAVVWLGDDVVKPSQQRHRARRPFHDAVSSFTLSHLYRRRYFQRVWIIQELLLSPHSILPLGTNDYVLMPDVFSCLEKAPHIELALEPWTQHIHRVPVQVRIGEWTADLYQVLKQTWASQATDPRDKIFGILGLTSDGVFGVANQSGGYTIGPDYSISVQSTMIGIFSYLLLNLRRVEVLLNAAGPSNFAPYPSWMPNWRRTNIWSELTKDRVSPCDTLPPFHQTHLHWEGKVFRVAVGSVSGHVRERLEEYGTGWEQVECHPHAWHQPAVVDSMNGVLSLDLIHLLKIDSSMCWQQHYHERIITWDWNEQWYLRLYGSSQPALIGPQFEEVYGLSPGSDLFLLERNKPRGLLVLCLQKLSSYAMTEAASARTSSTQQDHFQLVWSLDCLSLEIFTKIEPTSGVNLRSIIPMSGDQSKYEHPSYWIQPWTNLHQILTSFHHIFTSLFDRRPTEWKSNFVYPAQGLTQHFLLGIRRSLVTVVQTLNLLQTASDLRSFGPSYVKILRSHPRSLFSVVRQLSFGSPFKSMAGTVEFTINLRDITDEDFEIMEALTALPEQESIFSWMDRKGNDVHRHWQKLLVVQARCGVDTIQHYLKTSYIYFLFCQLNNYSYATGEDPATMVFRGPRESDKNVYPRVWPVPAEDIKRLELDGVPRQVCIV